MDDGDNFLAEIGFFICLVILAMIFIPILLGLGLAFMAEATGFLFWGIIITVSAVIWLMMGILMAI